MRRSILAAAFRHIGPAAALAADRLRHRAHQFSGVHLGGEILRDRGNHRDPSSPADASTTTALFQRLRRNRPVRAAAPVHAIDARCQHSRRR